MIKNRIVFIDVAGALYEDTYEGKPCISRKDVRALYMLHQYYPEIKFYLLYSGDDSDHIPYSLSDYRQFLSNNDKVCKLEQICMLLTSEGHKISDTEVHILWGHADLLPVKADSSDCIGKNWMYWRNALEIYKPADATYKNFEDFLIVTKLTNKAGHGAIDELIYKYVV